MNRSVFRSIDFEAEEEHLARKISRLKGNTEDDKQGLHFEVTGFVVFLAAQVVVPIIVSFISSTLYDKYKEIRTQKPSKGSTGNFLQLISSI